MPTKEENQLDEALKEESAEEIGSDYSAAIKKILDDRLNDYIQNNFLARPSKEESEEQ